MSDTSDAIFKDISSYRRLSEMIDDGHTEDLYLECKAPSVPRVDRSMSAYLAMALSGFSNTAGGVMVYGVSTTPHKDAGDVLTAIEPIGNVKMFENQLRRLIPTLTTPQVTSTRTKILRRRKADTQGVVVLQIPKTTSDPVQSVKDDKFHFRMGDGFSPAPYEIIKRLFSASNAPALRIDIPKKLSKITDDGIHRVPIFLSNNTLSPQARRWNCGNTWKMWA